MDALSKILRLSVDTSDTPAAEPADWLCNATLAISHLKLRLPTEGAACHCDAVIRLQQHSGAPPSVLTLSFPDDFTRNIQQINSWMFNMMPKLQTSQISTETKNSVQTAQLTRGR